MARRELAGKRILITGASEGIGRQLAMAAARAGCRVLGTARSAARLQTLLFEVRDANTVGFAEAPNRGERTGSIVVVAADINSAADRQRLFDEACKQFGGLDILVNNAGVGASGEYVDLQPETLRSVFELNLFALAEMIRLFLPTLKLGVQPLIVNVSSILGRKGYPGLSVYSASKFAVQGLSDAIRAELSVTPVRVLVVNPGPTETDFLEHELEQDPHRPTYPSRRMPADKVAQGILRAVVADKAEVTFTFVGRLLIFAARFAPSVFDFFARRQLRKTRARQNQSAANEDR